MHKKADMKFIVIINFATSIGPKGNSWFLYDGTIFIKPYARQLHVTFCDNATNILYEILDECIDFTRVKLIISTIRNTNIILKNYVLQKHYLGKSFTKEYVARMKTKTKL